MATGKYIASWEHKRLDFTFEARTSRGSLWHKDTYILSLTSPDGRSIQAEIPLFKGLSAEDTPDFENLLSAACADPIGTLAAPSCSSIAFGFESAFDMLSETPPTSWELGQVGISINGLIWMGEKELMRKRISEKLDAGFKILKLKIGGIAFDDEVELLREIRKSFSGQDLELRLDANGSFSPSSALEKLNILSTYDIHSIEQPIKAGLREEMARICRKSPVAIALDEELIGMRSHEEKVQLITDINPQYIILKPALCGGFKAASDYAEIAGEGRWWATSALESNIGLYAIGRWLSRRKLSMPHGLGTGQLYSNNIPLGLFVEHGCLWHDKNRLQ